MKNEFAGQAELKLYFEKEWEEEEFEYDGENYNFTNPDHEFFYEYKKIEKPEDGKS
jgi:hypothetical protein